MRNGVRMSKARVPKPGNPLRLGSSPTRPWRRHLPHSPAGSGRSPAGRRGERAAVRRARAGWPRSGSRGAQAARPRRARGGRGHTNHSVPESPAAAPGGRDAMTHGTRAARRGAARRGGGWRKEWEEEAETAGAEGGGAWQLRAGSGQQQSRRNCGGGVRESGGPNPSSPSPPPQPTGASAGPRDPAPHFLRLLPPPLGDGPACPPPLRGVEGTGEHRRRLRPGAGGQGRLPLPIRSALAGPLPSPRRKWIRKPHGKGAPSRAERGVGAGAGARGQASGWCRVPLPAVAPRGQRGLKWSAGSAPSPVLAGAGCGEGGRPGSVVTRRGGAPLEHFPDP